MKGVPRYKKYKCCSSLLNSAGLLALISNKQQGQNSKYFARAWDLQRSFNTSIPSEEKSFGSQPLWHDRLEVASVAGCHHVMAQH